MKHKIFCLFAFALIFIGLHNTTKIIANDWTADRVEDLVDGLIAFNEKESGAADEQSLVNIWSVNPEANEWYTFGLSRYNGNLDFKQYKESLSSYLSNNTVKSTASQYKYALVLIATGGKNETYILNTADEITADQGIMSLVFSLHLLNNIDGKETEKNEVRDKLLLLQLKDGGFAVSGEYGDTDVTAMTIQSLSPLYDTDEKVKNAIDKALDFLSLKQEPTGDYKSYGQCNPESASQVLVALCSVGIDPASDERFIKNGNTVMDGIARYRLEDGSYSHILGGVYNRNATIQAFYSYVALWRFYSGKTPLYIITAESAENPRQEESGITEPALEPTLTPSGAVTPKDNQATGVPSVQTSSFNKGLTYKHILSIVIVIITLLAMILLTLFKKRNYKNYLFAAILGVIALIIVFTTKIQSKDEYYNDNNTATDSSGKVTIEVRCDTIINKNKTAAEINPVIIKTTEYNFSEGESCYDILVKACKDYKITIDSKGSAGMVYVSGINLLYEFDYGDLSGWMYYVNGEELPVSCDSYKVKDGDVIKFLYTCELGKDLK